MSGVVCDSGAGGDDTDGVVQKLNLGCGNDYREGWVNLDSVFFKGEADVRVDLEEADLPFEDSFFDEIYASHVLEHVIALPQLMDELQRVIKPTGELHVRVPHGGSDDAWEDPTHVRAFFPLSFSYFTAELYEGAQTSSYMKRFWDIKSMNLVPHPDYREQPLDELRISVQKFRNCILEIQVVLTPRS